MVLSHRAWDQTPLLVSAARKANSRPRRPRRDPSSSAKPVPPKAEGATPRSLADAHAELPAANQHRTAEKQRRTLFPAMPARDGRAMGFRRPRCRRNRWSPRVGPKRRAWRAQPARTPVTTELRRKPAVECRVGARAGCRGRRAARRSRYIARPAPSVPKLLGVMTGALALAGITAAVVFKLGGMRRRSRRRRTAGRSLGTGQ